MTNAVKYTPTRRVITVRIIKEGGALEALISVADTGIGISPESRERILRAFTAPRKPESRQGASESA